MFEANTIIYGLSMEEYLAHPGINSSWLRHMLFSAAAFKAAKDWPKSDTTSTFFGTAAHTAVLEPDTFLDRYLVQPEDWGSRSAQPGRKKWDDLKKQAKDENKLPIKHEEWIGLQAILKASANIPEIKELMRYGTTEVTAFAEYDGLARKARADLVSIFLGDESRCMIWDLKTTTKGIATDDQIFKLIFDSGYHFQAAHQTETYNMAAQARCEAKAEGWGWIFVSVPSRDNPAVSIRLVPCPDELLQWGRKDHGIAIDNLRHCLKHDTWPGLPHVVGDLQIPAWARRIYEC